MKAPQNRLAKLNSGIESWVAKLFSIFGTSPIQPAEIAQRLKSAMEDGALQEGVGYWLAPNVYKIYLSSRDYDNLTPGKPIHVEEWRNALISHAQRRHYVLKTDPVISLYRDNEYKNNNGTGLNLRVGTIHIESTILDNIKDMAKFVGPETISSAGVSETQQLDPQQLALLREQLAPRQPLPGIDNPVNLSPYQIKPSANNRFNPAPPAPGYPNQPRPFMPANASSMPRAQLTIRLPQGGQQIYQIEKPETNIGRQLLNNDIVVEDKRVSRYHAKIIYGSDGQFTIINLSSTNGIVINGRPINHGQPQPLQNGTRFTIGSYEFYFERR